MTRWCRGRTPKSNVDQGIANIDYVVSDMDRLTGKYYLQNNPTTNPVRGGRRSARFSAATCRRAARWAAINNTMILSPSLTWQQHAGFTRLRAYANTGQQFTPSDFGMNLLGATNFPQFEITDVLGQQRPGIRAQRQFRQRRHVPESVGTGTSVNWVKGRHTIAIGGSWDHTQLNIINNNTSTDTLGFKSFLNFVEGAVRTGSYSAAFSGSASRYYRSDTAGAYRQRQLQVPQQPHVDPGLRWDFDGPLSEKYGRLTASIPACIPITRSTDTITNSGLEVAGNNPLLGTPGASDSLLTQHQWGLAPRIGLAWTPSQS